MATELRAVRENGYDRFIASVGDNWPALEAAGMAKGRESRAGGMATALRRIAAEHEESHGKYWPLKSDGGSDVHHVASRLATHLEKEKPDQAVIIKDYGV